MNNLSVCLAEHPDQSFVNTIIDYAVHGVPIGYTGPREFRECVNWPSARQYRTAVEASIEKDVKKGRKLGPFATPPSENFVGSPMGAFPKKHSVNKYRVIHDLSWPPGRSVNDFITDD